MTGRTVLSFQEWEAQSGMGQMSQDGMGMPHQMEMPNPAMGEEIPSHEPVKHGEEIMPVNEPGDLGRMDEPMNGETDTNEPVQHDQPQDENDPMMMDYQ